MDLRGHFEAGKIEGREGREGKDKEEKGREKTPRNKFLVTALLIIDNEFSALSFDECRG